MQKWFYKKYGTAKAIPELIIAGASSDDIFVIVLFSTFISMAQGGSASVMDFFNIPISIILGIVLGFIVGYLSSFLFEEAYKRGCYIRNSMKTIIILALSFALMSIETLLKGKLSISGLIAVVSMALTIKEKSPEIVSKRIGEKFGKLWLCAEVFLFVLVGAVLLSIFAIRYLLVLLLLL